MLQDTPAAVGPGAETGLPERERNALLLAFDTSTECLSVALQSPDKLSVWDGVGGPAASTRLIPQIHRMLDDAELTFAQLQGIAFAAGPGAFTGLRTACAVAQGLALGAALPVIAVDSLMIVAEAARVANAGRRSASLLAIDVVIDARMGEIYAGRYVWHDGRWQTRCAPALYTPETLNEAWAGPPPACIAGSALEAFGSRVRSAAALRIARPGGRAAALMNLAQALWRDGAAVDAALALPVYLRDKVALTEAERRPAA
jgi:tRNA threonylcarbamoyladenosine biosynthesis protein TsaB